MKLSKKGSTKKRVIHNPDKLLRVIQWRILSTYLNHVPVPEYVHGFEKGKSIPLMAKIHTNQDCVISVDIENFFPSIKQAHVASLFSSLGFGKTPAWILSELCTYKTFVPQGALTSPKISSLVTAGTFGPAIAKYCRDNQLCLSIYADDITMSFSRKFENRTERGKFVRDTINFVKDTLAKHGFRVNHQKTKVVYDGRRQWVCGAVVNRKVNLRKTERGNLKALVHNCEKNGIPSESASSGMDDLTFIRKFGGRLNWFAQLNPEAGSELKNRFFTLAKPLMKQYPDVELEKISWSSTLEDSDWEIVESVEAKAEGPEFIVSDKVLDVGDFKVKEPAIPF